MNTPILAIGRRSCLSHPEGGYGLNFDVVTSEGRFGRLAGWNQVAGAGGGVGATFQGRGSSSAMRFIGRSGSRAMISMRQITAIPETRL